MVFYPQWVFTTGGQRQQRQIWGTCAGLILLADRVYDTDQSTQLRGIASNAGQELERQPGNIQNGDASSRCITPQRVRLRKVKSKNPR